EDRAVRPQPMERHGRVLEEVGEFQLEALQRSLCALALFDLGLQSPRLLLELRHFSKALLGMLQCRIAFHRNRLGMLRAHLEKWSVVRNAAKTSHRVGTQERKAMLLPERVPEFFEMNGGLALPSFPQQRNHLAEHSDAKPSAGYTGDEIADHGGESAFIRPAVI